MANNLTSRPALFFLKAAWGSFLENKEVVILLALFYAMVTLVMPSPFRALIIGGEAADDQGAKGRWQASRWAREPPAS